jgi:hypothetical protein
VKTARVLHEKDDPGRAHERLWENFARVPESLVPSSYLDSGLRLGVQSEKEPSVWKKQIIRQTQQLKMLSGAVGMIADRLSLKPARYCRNRSYRDDSNDSFHQKLLTAAFGLLSALTAQAAPKKNPSPTPTPIPAIPISALPFTISTPGTYKETQNLTGSIWIVTGVQGPIILDLGGFILTAAGPGGSISNIGILIGGFPGDPDASNPYPITIQNGTVSNCSFGVWVGAGSPMSAVTIQNLTINILPEGQPGGKAFGILFERSRNSAVRSCTISAPSGTPSIGIQDDFSPGGNVYNNVTFNNIQEPLVYEPDGEPVQTVLSDCSFAMPVAP